MGRKHLTELEVEKLIKAAKTTRNPTRNMCMILLMYRHGLRVSEATRMLMEQIDIESKVFYTSRLKNGFNTVHPMQNDEIKAIKAWLVTRSKLNLPVDTRLFFVSEQLREIDRSGINQLLANLSKIAELPMVAHPHMLRHACGYALADRGTPTEVIQHYLGHKNVSNTVIYTGTNSARFEGIWK